MNNLPDALPLSRHSFSLSRRGAWGQVTLAAILITILPALILAWVGKNDLDGTPLHPLVVWFAAGLLIAVIALGYSLLFKYPSSIVRLRHYLNTLAGGKIPDQVTLSKDEDDLAAVQHYMELIVKMASDRIRIAEKQHAEELEAERQRVMVESIGTMCHHLGQPATVMSLCLYRLKTTSDPQAMALLVIDCQDAFDSMTRILDQLRTTLHYSSELYLPFSSDTCPAAEKMEIRIIKVGIASGPGNKV
jgi:signal transduction histidine kinase